MTKLPAFDWPRGLSRLEAARYVGVSPGTFDKLVLDGLMPRPKRVRSRLIFDRGEIHLAFSELDPKDDRNDFDA